MPNGDGTGPDGNGPKNINQGVPTPKRDGSGAGNGIRRGGAGARQGQGRGCNRGFGRKCRRN